jgi:hypothetical protein
MSLSMPRSNSSKNSPLWKQPSLSGFDDVFAESPKFVDELVSTLANISSSRFISGKACVFFLAHLILDASISLSSVTRKELDNCNSGTVRALEKALALEIVPALTQNTGYLKSEEKKWNLSYSQICEHSSTHFD